MSRKTPTPQTQVIWTLVILCFAAGQFPGVLFFQSVSEPRILGLPFIYGYILIIWAILCAVLLWAYLARWGRPRPEELGPTEFDAVKRESTEYGPEETHFPEPGQRGVA